MPGDNISETIIVQVNCPGKSIVDFITSVPVGMTKSPIQNPSTGSYTYFAISISINDALYQGVYTLTLQWIPSATQFGPQGVCLSAIDNTQVQSNQLCVTYIVDIERPNRIRPTMIQNSTWPIGKISGNQTVFSIQSKIFSLHEKIKTNSILLASVSVTRPARLNTYIYFWDATLGDLLVKKYDCSWESEVIYANTTIRIHFPVAPWVAGHSYYVTFDAGI